MKVTRIYTGDDGQSHFEDLQIPMTVTEIGAMSGAIPSSATFFRDTANGGPEVIDFHVAPRRQFVIHLAGRAEIVCGNGDSRTFGVGDILLADDTTGQGHISKQVQGPRVQVFIALDPKADIDRWRA